MILGEPVELVAAFFFTVIMVATAIYFLNQLRARR